MGLSRSSGPGGGGKILEAQGATASPHQDQVCLQLFCCYLSEFIFSASFSATRPAMISWDLVQKKNVAKVAIFVAGFSPLLFLESAFLVGNISFPGEKTLSFITAQWAASG